MHSRKSRRFNFLQHKYCRVCTHAQARHTKADRSKLAMKQQQQHSPYITHNVWLQLKTGGM
jgi:hypothetical protein